MLIMDIKNNLVSPRHGLPLIGAAQDYVSGCAILTRKDTVLSSEDAAFLLAMAGLSVDLDKKKYTGREIFSMLLPQDLNFEGESRVYKSTEDDDAYVRIKDGKLMSGIIDTATIGRESGSLLQYMFVRYGGELTSTFIDRIVKISLAVLLKFGISGNIGEFDLPEVAYKEIQEEVNAAEEEVNKLVKNYDASVENEILSITERIRGKARRIVSKYIKTEGNSINDMMITGAKASMINYVPTSAIIGQQLLRDVRLTEGYDGRLVSHFKRGDVGLAAKGFVFSSYKKGLNPVEFFFHESSSREGLMDNVIRTPVSGYLYRRLSSALQDLKVADDLSVREGNAIVEFKYGEDGVDISLSDKGSLNIWM